MTAIRSYPLLSVTVRSYPLLSVTLSVTVRYCSQEALGVKDLLKLSNEQAQIRMRPRTCNPNEATPPFPDLGCAQRPFLI